MITSCFSYIEVDTIRFHGCEFDLQIRDTPHKHNHKFIEFYDIRAAETALRTLNRSDVAGKQIKLEASRPGGARRYGFHLFHALLSLFLSQVGYIRKLYVLPLTYDST